ncbi:energy transducer TonB [Flagellimonas zhangzhouensis]|uniref:Protein TonB n=1 Tax=Flagellimonas zhangzhouensis TaxID=1073328 RepID=A0A1H2X5Q0_9FLAO|nr:energy transducer TonB [Allomuricauda zhangzhouensis]SDQ28309.1 protein TonB [Allomuricauda zhangzhouensis]SDW88117.1 protein TonB [Allomuricauda zhangzhouensis]
MIRAIFITIALFSFKSIFSQSEINYFPQEEIILTDCANSSNNSQCVYEYLQSKVTAFLNDPKKAKYLLKYEKDTLHIGARLIFDQNNQVLEDKSYATIRDKNLGKKYNKALEDLFYNLNIKEIINRKPQESLHEFSYQFLITKMEGETDIASIEVEKDYTGGAIHQIPRFPGCESLTEQEARTCFQEKMQNHIKTHFNYPKKAIEKRISGTVYIIFTINKYGTVENIRMRGDTILQGEALRIVNLLPTFTPATVNGEPVKIPYSIPMHFRL